MASETVKGFKDYTGEEALKREVIKDVLVKNFRLYGFEPAETPVIEYSEFVKGNNPSDEAVSDIFRLQDKGKRDLALRYEFTFQLKRISQNKKMPYKRYQIGYVFRDEPTSSNRFRQITQCDADIVGSSIKDEAENLMMAMRIFKELGIKASIYFSNRKLLNEILDKEGIKNKDAVIREIDKLDKVDEKVLRENLKKYGADKILQILKKSKSAFEKYPSYKEIKEFEKYCRYYGVKAEFSPSLARGLSYYNGTIFEIKTAEMKETICAGGSYPINNVQATGISFGIDRLSSLAKIKVKNNRILVISIGQDEESIKLSEKLRDNNIPCIIMLGKISKALEFANSYSLPYVVFLGEEEAKKKKVKLRDMRTGKEEVVSADELVKLLNK